MSWIVSDAGLRGGTPSIKPRSNTKTKGYKLSKHWMDYFRKNKSRQFLFEVQILK